MQNILRINPSTNEVELKDGLGNIIQVTSGGLLNVASGGSATIGGFSQRLAFTSTGTQTSASVPFVAITGMASQAITTPIAGAHIIFFHYAAFPSGANTDMDVRLNIDSGAQFVNFQHLQMNTVGVWEHATDMVFVTLTAGTHTIQPEWSRSFGAGSNNADSSNPWAVYIQSLGSGINGLTILEDTNVASTVIASTLPVYQSVASINVTTFQNENVELKYNGTVAQTVAGGGVGWGYRIDAGSVIPISNSSILSGESISVNFSIITGTLTAAVHTIEIMMGNYGAGTTTLIGADTDNDRRFQLVRYRGGSVYGTPVDASIIPDTDNVYDLGSSAFRFNDIWAGGNINNQAAPLQLSSNDQNVNIGGGAGTSTLDLNIRTGATGTPSAKLTKGANNWAAEHGAANKLLFKYNGVTQLTLEANGNLTAVGDFAAANFTSGTQRPVLTETITGANQLLSAFDYNTDVTFLLTDTAGGTTEVGIDVGGFDGQIITIVNSNSSVGSVRFKDVTSTLIPGDTTKHISGPDNTLGARDVSQWMWLEDELAWFEIGESNNN